MGKPKKNNRLKGTRLLLFAAVALLAALAALAAAFMLSGGNTNDAGREFSVEDSCGLAFGKVLHTVEDDDACSGRCRSECIARDMPYKSHVFGGNSSESMCNTCRCYCK